MTVIPGMHWRGTLQAAKILLRSGSDFTRKDWLDRSIETLASLLGDLWQNTWLSIIVGRDVREEVCSTGWRRRNYWR